LVGLEILAMDLFCAPFLNLILSLQHHYFSQIFQPCVYCCNWKIVDDWCCWERVRGGVKKERSVKRRDVMREESEQKGGGVKERWVGGWKERRGVTAYKQLCHKPTYVFYIQSFYTAPLHSTYIFNSIPHSHGRIYPHFLQRPAAGKSPKKNH
jgi:hypothetical protein